MGPAENENAGPLFEKYEEFRDDNSGALPRAEPGAPVRKAGPRRDPGGPGFHETTGVAKLPAGNRHEWPRDSQGCHLA